jgi:hypothetical protein
LGDTLSELKASVEKLEQTIKDAKRNKRERGQKSKSCTPGLQTPVPLLWRERGFTSDLKLYHYPTGLAIVLPWSVAF